MAEQTNNIDKILSEIVDEKAKLEKLTKKAMITNKGNGSGSGSGSGSGTGVDLGIGMNSKVNNDVNHTRTKKNTRAMNSVTSVNTINKLVNDHYDSQLNLKHTDFKDLDPSITENLMELITNYVNMDKTFRDKHETLKSLYKTYGQIYNKHKNSKSNNITASDIPKHEEMLKNIHTEMKDNNTNLYKERILILKKIKDIPELQPVMKDQICGRLLAVFKSPPVTEYKQYNMLEGNDGMHSNTSRNGDDKIDVKELDDAYLQKHNELMTVYKAYQSLFNKVLNYKDQLDKYKQLPTGSSISRTHMDKLIKDQGFVMNMIDKMQDQLISNNIISNSEKVPISPVVSHPENINTFNNTMRDQIRHIIDRRIDIKPDTKIKLEDLLKQYQECDSNDKFCSSGKKILLLKKM